MNRALPIAAGAALLLAGCSTSADTAGEPATSNTPAASASASTPTPATAGTSSSGIDCTDPNLSMEDWTDCTSRGQTPPPPDAGASIPGGDPYQPPPIVSADAASKQLLATMQKREPGAAWTEPLCWGTPGIVGQTAECTIKRDGELVDYYGLVTKVEGKKVTLAFKKGDPNEAEVEVEVEPTP